MGMRLTRNKMLLSFQTLSAVFRLRGGEEGASIHDSVTCNLAVGCYLVRVANVLKRPEFLSHMDPVFSQIAIGPFSFLDLSQSGKANNERQHV